MIYEKDLTFVAQEEEEGIEEEAIEEEEEVDEDLE